MCTCEVKVDPSGLKKRECGFSFALGNHLDSSKGKKFQEQWLDRIECYNSNWQSWNRKEFIFLKGYFLYDPRLCHATSHVSNTIRIPMMYLVTLRLNETISTTFLNRLNYFNTSRVLVPSFAQVTLRRVAHLPHRKNVSSSKWILLKTKKPSLKKRNANPLFNFYFSLLYPKVILTMLIDNTVLCKTFTSSDIIRYNLYPLCKSPIKPLLKLRVIWLSFAYDSVRLWTGLSSFLLMFRKFRCSGIQKFWYAKVGYPKSYPEDKRPMHIVESDKIKVELH